MEGPGIGLGLGRSSSGQSLSTQVAALFASSEQGVWYDPSDFTSMYQDFAGVTPVTAVEQPVGLMLDKRLGTTRGAEVVSGNLTTGTNWTVVGNDGTHIVTFGAQGARFQSDTTTPTLTLSQVPPLVVGGWYEITITVSVWVSGSIKIDSAAGPFAAGATGVGSYRGVLLAGGSTLIITRSTTNVDLTIGSVSAKRILGNHALQATAASRPTLSARINQLNNSHLGGSVGGSPGNPPTSWTAGSTGGDAAPVGLAADGSVIWQHTVADGTGRPFYQQSMTALAIGDVVTESVYIDELVSGIPNIQDVLNRSGTAVCNFVWLKNGNVVTAATPIVTGDRIQMRATCTTAGTNFIRLGLGSSSALNGSVKFSRPQYEYVSTASPQPTRYQRTGPQRNLLTKTDTFDVAPWTFTNASGTATRLGNTFTFGASAVDRVVEGAITVTAAAHVIKVTLSGTGDVRVVPVDGVGSTGGIVAITLTSTPTEYTVPRTFPTGGSSGGVGIYNNAAGTAGASVTIGRIQMELGTVATTYERVDTITTTYDTTGFPVGLRCDGVDDGMATANIDFSATDKLTAWAALAKSSDVATGTVIELSAASGSNVGSFQLRAPSGAAANYLSGVMGSIESLNTATTFTAPITNVLSLAADIAADTNSLRVNSVATSTATDLGTGNFGAAYPLYLFRRGGTTFPFIGLFYGAIIRGATTTAAQILALERQLGQKAGVAF